MLDYILKQDLHINYITAMAYKAFDMSCYVTEENIATYSDIALSLSGIGANFEVIIKKFIEDAEPFDKKEKTFFNILMNHPLNQDEKVEIVNSILSDNKIKNKRYLEEKCGVINKWKLFYNLQENLPNEIKKEKKVKI